MNDPTRTYHIISNDASLYVRIVDAMCCQSTSGSSERRRAVFLFVVGPPSSSFSLSLLVCFHTVLFYEIGDVGVYNLCKVSVPHVIHGC